VRRFASFDTEDDSKANTLLVTFYDGEKAYAFRDVERALEFMYNLGLQRTLYLVAHNLEYDLVNVFRGRLRCVEFRYFGDRLITAKLLGTRIVFWDSCNHSYHSPLAKLGEAVGFPKLESSHDWTRGKKLTEEDIRYACRDAEIVWRYMNAQQELYQTVGAEMKTTTPATAMDYWRRNYMVGAISGVSDPVRAYFKKAYYGGRVEIFRMKAKGSIRYYDINSLYPYVMQKPYPDVNSLTRTGKHGVIDATVEVPQMPIPPLPYRRDGKLLFPVGRFRGHWTTCEIAYARSVGARVIEEHNRVGSNRSVLPFRCYVDECYSRRLQAQNPLEKTMFKLLMNSLYGKFGSDGKTQRLVDPETVSEKQITGQEFMVGPLMCVTEESEPATYANILWAAWTTALARIELHKAIMAALKTGQEPLYCDTDSLVLKTDKKPPFKVGTKLGEWKLEASITRFEAKLPKVYKYVTTDGVTIKAKGVPKQAREAFFAGAMAKYKKPLRMREAAVQNGKANMWVLTGKCLRSRYDKRTILRGGKTDPLAIDAPANRGRKAP
jgi:hypothetical protein